MVYRPSISRCVARALTSISIHLLFHVP
jgi:hypothetical protein